MKLFDACVYTIVDEDDLLRADRGREPSDPLSEGKPWSKVAGWLAEAKDRDERVAIVFADAKDVHRWLGWAVLTDDLSIDPPGQRQRTTRYRFRNLRPLRGHPRSEFVLLQTGGPLPASHIRPYVHFRTPEFLRREAEQENGLLLSEWRQQPEVVAQARGRGFALSGQRPLEEADPGAPPRTTMRSSVDRSDAQEARRIFRRLYPEHAVLRTATTILADSVAEADTVGSGSWSVTLFEDMVRLNVGQVEVCTLVREGIKLVTCIPASAPLANGLTFNRGNGPAYRAAPIDSAHLYFDGRIGDSMPHEYIEAHHAYIKEAARQKRNSPYKRAFSVGVLLFLEAELKLKLPRPSYLDKLDKANHLRIAEEIIEVGDIYEGAVRTVAVNVYERDSRARQLCIEHYGARCAACGMSFEERYGSTMNGYIHVHHLRPLSGIGSEYRVDPVVDLRPVCPNCHAAIHSRSPPLTIVEVQIMLGKERDRNKPTE